MLCWNVQKHPKKTTHVCLPWSRCVSYYYCYSITIGPFGGTGHTWKPHWAPNLWTNGWFVSPCLDVLSISESTCMWMAQIIPSLGCLQVLTYISVGSNYLLDSFLDWNTSSRFHIKPPFAWYEELLSVFNQDTPVICSTECFNVFQGSLTLNTL